MPQEKDNSIDLGNAPVGSLPTEEQRTQIRKAIGAISGGEVVENLPEGLVEWAGFAPSSKADRDSSGAVPLSQMAGWLGAWSSIMPDSKEDAGWAYGKAEIDSIFARIANVGITPAGFTDVELLAACTAAGPNGVVRLTPGATYTISGSVILPPRGTIVAEGATIRRCDHVPVTLTAAVPANTRVLQVDNVPADWRVGRTRLTISVQDGHYGQNALGANETMAVIASIAGNTVTMDRNLLLPSNGSLNAAGEYPVGAQVANVSPQLIFNGDTNTVIGGTFDGQRDQYIQRDWTMMNCITQNSSTSRRKVVINCKFRNQPSSAVVACGSFWLEGCDFENTSGSIVHMSAETNVTRGYFIANNSGRNVNTDSAVMGHEEALITFSWAPTGVKIINNDFVDGGGKVFGNMQTQTGAHELVVMGNTFRNFKAIGLVENTTGAVEGKAFVVYANSFINCGDLVFRANLPARELTGVMVGGNYIEGGRILMDIQGQSPVSVWNNRINLRDYTLASNPSVGGNSRGAIVIYAGRVSIFGNNLQGPTTPGDVLNGILISGGYAAGNTRFVHGDHYDIKGNVVDGFRAGIAPLNTFDPTASRLHKATTIEGNYVRGADAATDVVGITVPPGAIARGNTVLVRRSNHFGIITEGVPDGAAYDVMRETVLGGISVGNTVLGPAGANRLLLAGVAYAPTCRGNVTCVGNLLTGSVVDNTIRAFLRTGAGADGVITVTAASTGVAGNDLSVRAVNGVGNNVALSAAIAGNAITVTLGTNGSGTPDPAKNTSALVAAAIDALPEVTATASGDGSTVVAAFAAKYLSGGSEVSGNIRLPARGIDTVISLFQS